MKINDHEHYYNCMYLSLILYHPSSSTVMFQPAVQTTTRPSHWMLVWRSLIFKQKDAMSVAISLNNIYPQFRLVSLCWWWGCMTRTRLNLVSASPSFLTILYTTCVIKHYCIQMMLIWLDHHQSWLSRICILLI